MRVLHVVPTFYPAVAYGGPIYSLLRLCLGLDQFGCEVRVLTTDANRERRLSSSEQQHSRLSSLKVHFSPRVGRGMVAPQLLKRLTEEVRWADMVHLTAVYNFPTIPTLLLTRLNGKPLVWSPRGALQRWVGSRRVWAKASWENACRSIMPRRTALHFTSEEEGLRSGSRLGNLPAWVIPNGIDIPRLPTPPPNDGVLKLLFVGRLDPIKGIENLIEAARLLHAPDWRLRIAGQGDPSYVAKLRCITSDPRVQFCGHLQGDDKYRAFAHSDVVIVPSYSENFGLVVAEALSHARPVIASRGTPWREVEDRGCGLWVHNDPPALAAAIQQIAASDRAAMGLRGREWMQQSFSWRESARCMFALYQHLLK